MKIVNVGEPGATLSMLVAQVEHGEDVVIARDGEPVAKLVRYGEKPRRQRGAWRELPGWASFEYDPAIFAPMTDAELAAEGWV